MTPPGDARGRWADPRLASLVLLTDRNAAMAAGRDLIETVTLAVQAGARAVVLREKDLVRHDRATLAGQLREIVPQLIVSSDVELACEVGADGVHLAASDPWPATTPGLVLGRSCHNTDEVRRAAAEGAVYVTLSPIFPSASKPGYGPPLGVDVLGDHPVAVYALGGIEPGRARACVAAGAAGVAVMGAVMGAADPAGVVAQFLAEMEVRT